MALFYKCWGKKPTEAGGSRNTVVRQAGPRWVGGWWNFKRRPLRGLEDAYVRLMIAAFGNYAKVSEIKILILGGGFHSRLRKE